MHREYPPPVTCTENNRNYSQDTRFLTVKFSDFLILLKYVSFEVFYHNQMYFWMFILRHVDAIEFVCLSLVLSVK
jgi:hypothetical protein